MAVTRPCLVLLAINVVSSVLPKLSTASHNSNNYSSCKRCPARYLRWIPGLRARYCTSPAMSESPWCEPTLPLNALGDLVGIRNSSQLKKRGHIGLLHRHATKKVPRPPVCGVSGGARPARSQIVGVVGGHYAPRGKYPWMALLGHHLRNGSVWFLCGGSLISSRLVLTAAHCIVRKHNFLVRVGEHDIRERSAVRRDVAVWAAVGHRDYARPFNDIAMLVLRDAVEFNDFVKPICLPTKGDIDKSYTDKIAFSAGWGHTDNERKSSVLQEVALPVMSRGDCKHFYPETGAGHICAGLELGGPDTCQGDSGGPLMLQMTKNNLKGVWVLIGIVSFGRKCGEAYSPGVYTRVTHFYDWINTFMENY